MGLEENKVQKSILEFINKKEYIYEEKLAKSICDAVLYRVNSKGIKGRKSTLPPGFPDLCGDIWISGRGTMPLYVEVKSPDKKCTNEDQLDFIKQAIDRGALALWCNSLEGFKEYLLRQV